METTTIFGQYGVDATGAQTARPMYLLQWLRGERKIVWPDGLAEAMYVIPTPEWTRR